jgi:hypothetical protein
MLTKMQLRFVTKYEDKLGRSVKTEWSIWTYAGRSSNLKHFVTLKDVQPVRRNKEHSHNLAVVIPLCVSNHCRFRV